MGSFREYRSGKWQVEFRYKGQRFCLYRYMDGTVLVHKVLAQKLLRHIEQQIQAGQFNPAEWKGKKFLFEEAVKQWEEGSTCSEEWLAQRKRIAKQVLKPYFKGRDIRDIKSMDIGGFHKALKQTYKDKTIYNIIGELKALLNYHKDSLTRMPSFPKVSNFQDAPIKWLSKEDQNRVFQYIPSEHKPIFTFMRYTGCRPNEARGLPGDCSRRTSLRITLHLMSS